MTTTAATTSPPLPHVRMAVVPRIQQLQTHKTMPIASVPLSITVLSALGFPIVAVATLTPAPDSYTLAGAALGVFCVIAYLRSQKPDTGIWTLLFNAVATGAIGWIMPEPFAQYMLRQESLSTKAWAGLALILSLAGGAMVAALLSIFRKRIPEALEVAAERYIPHPPRQQAAPTVRLAPKNSPRLGSDTAPAKPTEP